MGADPTKILLVDDDPRNLDVLESLLNSPEHELVRAQTADQALMLLLEGEFAVIVLDIRMPGISGIELAVLIKQRKRTQHIPIIFLTAYHQDDDDVLMGYGSGAVDYLTKPVNPQILRSKIAVFVDLFRKTRALAATNAALEQEVAQRLRAEEALLRTNNELEARVNARTSELSRANRAKDDFLAALSHELRTPLNPVLLLASHSADDPGLPHAIRADFDMIRRNVELEARLIDDLLDLTRIARGILSLDMRAIDADAIVRDAIAVVRPEAEEKGLELKLDLGSPKRTVRGDSVRLQQVLWNLVKNAVKFTPAGGRIAIETRTREESGEWVVRITDTGIGMTAADIGNVFEAFAQGEHARQPGSHRFGGLGLGLAISRTLVKMHGGVIEAASEGRDKGSTFTVILPLLNAPPERPEPSRQPAAPARRGARRLSILLVEDHESTRATLAHVLESHDYDVTSAESATVARAAAAKRRFDLVISDIGLPDGDGCELFEELRAGSPGLPGIALSGYGMDEDLRRSRVAGFASHITKPIAVDALDDAIQAVMGGVPMEMDSPD